MATEKEFKKQFIELVAGSITTTLDEHTSGQIDKIIDNLPDELKESSANVLKMTVEDVKAAIASAMTDIEQYRLSLAGMSKDQLLAEVATIAAGLKTANAARARCIEAQQQLVLNLVALGIKAAVN